MKKRTVIFGDYNTAAHGWTLTGILLSDPEQKLNYVEKPGGDGSWDLSTVLTDGIPRYKDRSLTVTLECSEGTRDDREQLINEMVNNLDGMIWQIILPDRPDHFLTGRIHVSVNYSNLAHAAVTVTGTVAPWFYSARETIVELTATEVSQTVYLNNNGRRAVVPEITVTGDVNLETNGMHNDFADGSYEWSALLLKQGLTALHYEGNGKVIITYREAVLR